MLGKKQSENGYIELTMAVISGLERRSIRNTEDLLRQKILTSFVLRCHQVHEGCYGRHHCVNRSSSQCQRRKKRRKDYLDTYLTFEKQLKSKL